MLTLYDYLPSQNAWKVRCLLAHLQRPYQTEVISIFEGAGQSEAYRHINPTGAVPAIKLDDGRVLAESNAILTYLAHATPYLPDDPYARAKVLQWLSFEQNYVEMQIGTLRYWTLTGKLPHREPQMLASRRAASLRAMAVLESELATREFIAGSAYTIADLSLYAYGSRAEEAGLPLEAYPHLRAWISRVEAQPRFLHAMHPYSIDPHSSAELGALAAALSPAAARADSPA